MTCSLHLQDSPIAIRSFGGASVCELSRPAGDRTCMSGGQWQYTSMQPRYLHRLAVQAPPAGASDYFLSRSPAVKPLSFTDIAGHTI